MNAFNKLAISICCIALVACGGGGTSSESTGVVVSSELLQTTETAVVAGVTVARQNASYAVLGDVYTTKIDVVPVDKRNSVEHVEVKNLNTQGASPVLDPDGNLTWTPNQADYTGASTLSVKVKPKVGAESATSLYIPVYKKRVAIDTAVASNGGTYADENRHYLIEVKPNSAAGNLAGTLLVHEFLDKAGRLVDRRIRGKQLRGATINVISAPILEAATSAQSQSLQTQAEPDYPLKSLDLNNGAFKDIYAEADNPLRIDGKLVHAARVGSLLDIGANVFTSRKADIYNYSDLDLIFDDPATVESKAHQVFDYFTSCQDEDCKTQAKSKSPIVLIHGFTGDDNVFGFGTDAKGGAYGTFGGLPALLIAAGHPVFEFRWHTYMRFEEAAGRFNQFTLAVAKEMGVKPIVLAHSFGGIVATLAVQGQGIEYAGRWAEIPYKGHIAQLVTFNSPLSGINDNETVLGKHIAKKTSYDGAIEFQMTRGRDVEDTTIGKCYAITCVQAGAHLNNSGRNLDGLQFNSALIANVPDVKADLDGLGDTNLDGNHEWQKKRVWAGEVIHKLHKGTIPPAVKVLRFAGFRNLWPNGSDMKANQAGDGLISLVGQAAYPEHFVSNPYDEAMNFKYRFIDGDNEYPLYASFDKTRWEASISEPTSDTVWSFINMKDKLTQVAFRLAYEAKTVVNLVLGPAHHDVTNLYRAYQASESGVKQKKVRDLLPGECIKWDSADDKHLFPYIVCARSSHTGDTDSVTNGATISKKHSDLLDFSVVNLGSEDAFISHPLRVLVNDVEWLSSAPVQFAADCSVSPSLSVCPKPKVFYTSRTELSAQSDSITTQAGVGVPAVLFVTFTDKITGAVKRDFAGATSDEDGNWRYDVAAALRSRFGDAAKLKDYRMWVALVSLKYKPYYKTVENLSADGGDLGVFLLKPLGQVNCPSGQIVGPDGGCVATEVAPSLAINFDPASQFQIGAQNMQAVSFTAGRNGRYAAKFGGVSNPGYIRIPNASTMQFTDGASFDFYARMDSMIGMDGYGSTVTNGAYAMTLLAKSHDRAGISFLANSMSDGKTAIWSAAFDPSMNGSCVHVPRPAVPLGTWVRVTYTMSSTQGIRGYLDKQLAFQCPTARPNFSTMNARDLYIGKFDDEWYPLNGAIQDIRVYKKALTSAEVTSLN